MTYKNITVSEAISSLDQYIIIDVRPTLPSGIPAIKGSQNVPLEHIKQLDLPKDSNILVYCTMGVRSVSACEALVKMGFSNITNLKGGINSWITEGYATVPYNQ